MHRVQVSDIQLYGIKRSGHHAIVYWILGHYDSYHYYNNCIVKSKIVQAEEVYKTGSPPSIVLSSFEDRQDSLKNSSLRFLGQHLPTPKITRVLVIRDPFNNYASRFKLGKEFHAIYQETKVWKELAKEYLGHTNHLGKNVVKVNYNKWFKSKGYRKELSEHFGVFTDKNYNYISEIGGGSSFDRRKYNGRSDKMQTLSRWREYVNNQKFIKTIFQDKELMELASEIFGNIFKI